MKLTGNQIMYLLTIKKISMNKHVIRSVDVASQMDYSRASIHKMLGTLKKMGLIEQEYYSSIKLTSLAQTLKPVVRLPEGYNLGICNLIELM